MIKVWTNGCFDVLHIGHIKLFEYARSLGDQLIVGIDSDTRVSSLKGPQRPVNNQEHRKIMLEALRYIDKVYIFNDEQELSRLVQENSVDYIVVGDDYINKRVVGSELVKETIFFPKIDNISTSNILSKIEQV